MKSLFRATFSFSFVRPVAVALATLLLPLAAQAQQSVLRQENTDYSATVTSFQTSLGSNTLHFATATVHFENKTKRPLILACDAGKVSITDDQGIAYREPMIRGIGIAKGNDVDAKFVLPPGRGADAVFEMRNRIPSTTQFGIAFDLSFSAREIIRLEGNQLRLGTEHAMEFTGLKNGITGGSEGNASVDAGAFTAELVRSKKIRNGRWMMMEMTLRLTNTSDKPLILAYEDRSSYGIDDQGNRFGYAMLNEVVSGIGVTSPEKADPQFVLAPGQSREVRITASRVPGREIAGTQMTYYVALQALEVLPSNQIREVRQFSLTFPGISIR